MSSQPKLIFFGGYTFTVSSEVYEPAEDTFLLARNLSVKENERVLDIGTGCGILAVLAAEKAEKVVAIDINPHAVACARRNAEKNRVTAKVEVRLGHLFGAIAVDEKFDLMLFNAPYLPVEPSEGNTWLEKAWAAGENGREVINRFIDEAPRYLAERGRILLVQSSLSDITETLKQFSKYELQAVVVDEEKVPFERIVLIEVSKH